MSGIPVYDDWIDVPVTYHGGVVPLGNFDGVHRGHQELIDQACGFARALEAPVIALTFEPHPRTFFVKDTAPFRLTSSVAKTRLLASYGVQAVLAQRFDPEFAAVAAEDFVDGILVAGLRARHVICGYDFTFGARRSGNVDLLQRMGADRGFAVTVVPPVMREGEIYSSTRIRESLRAGMVRDAADLLGHPWEIEGVVERGDQRGRTIGFSTANVALGEYLRPRFGVYAVRAAVEENGEWVWRDAVANLGRRPTFGKLQENFEVHVLNFNGDLYGRTMRVALIDFIRPEMKFAGLEALKTQIAADRDAARELLRAG